MLTRAVAINVLGTTGTLVIGFFGSILIARWLGPSDRGLLGLIASTSGFAVALFGLGWPLGVMYFASKREASQGALLGNTLGTVGFEVEAAGTPEQANRAMKMKVWLTFLTLLIAVGFFAANVIHPDKMLQSGRVMTAGMALGEVIPINPMPGLKIYKWHRGIWAGLFLLVVPTFFLINFFL